MSLINTDIYNIRNSIENIKRQYIPENEDTLALGIFGYLGDIQAKSIQTAIMLTGELENEVFPNRARLDKNIITHAIMQNITDINATPANMTIIIGITTDDLDKYMINNKFVFDKDFPIIITNENTGETYEYHLDYDIILTRSNRSSKTVYAAVYDIDKNNPISDITNPYLKQPYTIKMASKTYVFIQCAVHQIKNVQKYNQIMNNSIIDNKTFTFEFEDQLASFDIIVKEGGKEYTITPIFEGVAPDPEIEYFCYYTYITTNMIRVKFERTSFMPSLNAEIEINIKTTKGTEATFNYTGDMYINMKSDKYNYNNIITFIRPNTASKGAVDRKSTEELHNIIPKEMLSRGSITTTTDLFNYFNLLNTSENRMELMKKVDNQIERIYYSYFLLKNSTGNVVPTNTINLNIKDTDFSIYEENGTSVLPAGTMIEYDPETFIGHVVTESDSEFVYSTLYTLLVNTDPLYTSSYLTIINENPFVTFEYINQDSELQFIADKVNFNRHLLVDRNKYNFTFSANQSINIPLYDIEANLNTEQILDALKDRVKAIVVLYKEKAPYRYKEATLSEYDGETLKYTFVTDFETDNRFDLHNNIRINDIYVVGSDEKNYGYLNDSTETRIYILTKFDNVEYGRHDLDDIVPGLEGYSVTNIFEVYNGLSFFKNYSGLMDNRISVWENRETCEKYMYSISSVPVVGYEYTRQDEDNVFDLVEQMNYKKAYIDNALNVLENSFEIDFKFFNTYGPSRTYTIDEKGKIPIGRVDIVASFKLSLKATADDYTRDEIIADVKAYVENLENHDDFHISNLISYITTKYESAINYFGWFGFNKFDANEQHMYKQEVEDKTICPEFINIRNKFDVDGNIVPDIEIVTALI